MNQRQGIGWLEEVAVLTAVRGTEETQGGMIQKKEFSLATHERLRRPGWFAQLTRVDLGCFVAGVDKGALLRLNLKLPEKDLGFLRTEPCHQQLSRHYFGGTGFTTDTFRLMAIGQVIGWWQVDSQEARVRLVR